MNNEQLEKANKLTEQIKKLREASIKAVANIQFNMFPEMDYSHYDSFVMSLSNYYNKKIELLEAELKSL